MSVEGTMPAHSGKFVAYYRVSTDKQGKSGLGLDAQRQAVQQYLNGGRWSLTGEFTEVESGKRSDRPELAKALAACKRHKATLIIAKLDRLSRNVAFLAALMDRGVEFIACDNPTATRLTLHILAAVAEHEAKTISERTKAALQAAKRRGTKLGNPRLDDVRGRAVASLKASAARFAANVAPIIAEIRKSGAASNRGIARALNARGVATARGGKWEAVQVGAILRRT
jgi:DNA invertase Pin-like site-specific DNA recombinase